MYSVSSVFQIRHSNSNPSYEMETEPFSAMDHHMVNYEVNAFASKVGSTIVSVASNFSVVVCTLDVFISLAVLCLAASEERKEGTAPAV